MFGEDDFDNSAIDLNRVRKLAGLPNSAAYDAPTSQFEPEGSFDVGDDLDPEDMEGSAYMGDGMSMPDDGLDGPIAVDAPVTSPVMAAPVEQNHWTAMLSDLEQQMPDIPVGDFRDVIDSLRRLANYAEDIRRTLVTENRRTFKDYVAEAMQGVPTVPTVPSAPSAPTATKPMTASTAKPGQTQTIGNSRAEAVKTLQTRMGGDGQAAEKAFNNMQRKGLIKAQGSAFSMPSMDDDQFNTTVNDPSMNQ